jgi:hypothetical protein
MTWSDYTNKEALIKVLGGYTLENNQKFHNTSLNSVVRRFRPQGKYVEQISLGNHLTKYLPSINKDDIKYIEYGIFATEFKYKNGECKECEAKIKANEIKLLKVKH